MNIDIFQAIRKKLLFVFLLVLIFWLSFNFLFIKSFKENWALPISYFNLITDFELELGRDSSYAFAIKLWTKEQKKWSSRCDFPSYQVINIPANYDSERTSDIGKWLLKYDDFSEPICAKVKTTSEINDFAYVFITQSHIVFIYHEF